MHLTFLLVNDKLQSCLLFFRGIAQLVEQRSPKPRAEGSNPSTPASFFQRQLWLSVGFFLCDFVAVLGREF